MSSLGPYNAQRIRIPLSLFGGLNDDVTGSTPQFCISTDIQFELGEYSQNLLIDAANIASVSLALKPANNVDATPIISATVAPGSSGWNTNPAQVIGNDVIPSYAAYPFTGGGATATCTTSGNAVNAVSVGAGGSGYTSPPIVVFSGGGGSGASAVAVLTAGVVTSFTSIVGGAGYTSTPAVFLVPVASSYTIGTQTGATYQWTAGANDLTLTNGSAAVAGSNLVPATASFVSGAYTLTGLSPNTDYFYILGNATSVSGSGISLTTGSTVFRTNNVTTQVTINGPTSALVTAEVYAATVGQNIVNGAISYVSSTAQSASIITGTPSYSAVVAGQTYGTYTLTGLTAGALYSYSLGVDEPSPNGSVNGQTATTGTFIAPATSVVLTGLPLTHVTTSVYAATAGSYVLSGLTVGAIYYWTKSTNDTSLSSGSTNLVASGFFTATSSQATLYGSGGSLITAYVQQISTVATGTFVASGQSVTFTGVPSTPVTATLTGNVAWKSGNDQHCIIPFSKVATNIAAGNYWLLVTATTTVASGSKAFDLGAGGIVAVDQGEGTPTVVPNNIITVGAMYDGSGNYSQSNALVSGGIYYWTQGADDTGCAGLTASGTFIASSTTLALTGTASTAVTAAVVRLFVSNPVTGNVVVANGATGLQTVTGLSIPFVPTNIEVWLMGGAGDGYIPVVPVFGTWTQASFQYNIVGIIPNSNYVLGWRAS
jgi:hypothetical protein